MKNLYTFFLEYMKGTYISQLQGTSIENALFTWIETYNFREIGAAIDNQDLVKEIQELDKHPTPIDGVKNVWNVSFLIEDQLALVDIVKTSPD